MNLADTKLRGGTDRGEIPGLSPTTAAAWDLARLDEVAENLVLREQLELAKATIRALEQANAGLLAHNQQLCLELLSLIESSKLSATGPHGEAPPGSTPFRPVRSGAALGERLAGPKLPTGEGP